MREWFYKLLSALSRRCGTWIFVLLSRGVAAGYFIFSPRRVAVGLRFYAALFPGRGRVFHLLCTFRQFQNFTSVFLDRFLLQDGRPIAFSFEGREHLIEAMRRKTGGIILMSHMGNWEVAAHLLRRSLPDLPLLLYMGRRARDEIEHLQKEDLRASGIRIVAVDQGAGSPFDLVEGVSFLRSGGFVSMTGDMIWRSDQRVLPVRFLGRAARLPEVPHTLALVSGAPLFIFFAERVGPRRYHFSLSPPRHVMAEDRTRRRAALSCSAQEYAGRMEAQLRRSPFEWYHFEPFIEPGEERGSGTANPELKL